MGNTMEIQLLGNTASPSHVLNSAPTALTWVKKEVFTNRNKASEKKFLKN